MKKKFTIPILLFIVILSIINLEYVYSMSLSMNNTFESSSSYKKLTFTLTSLFVLLFFIFALKKQLNKKNDELQKMNEKLQKKEKHYSGIIRNSPIAIIIWDRNFRIIEWNKASERIFGWTRDEILGKPINIIIPEYNKDSFKRYIKDFNKVPSNIANNNLTKNNEIITCEWSNTFITDKVGNNINVISIAQDVTEKIKIENKLNIQNKTLKTYSEQLEKHIERIQDLSTKLEKIINLTDDLYESTLKDEKEFLSKLFLSSFDLIPEVDYGSVYLYKDENIEFINTVGHDLTILKEIPINSEIFMKSNDDVIIINNIVDYTLDKIDEDIREKFLKASKPIKETLKFDLYVNKERIAGFSLDIATGENKTFSENSKQIMQSFRNLANAFFTIRRYSINQEDFQKELVLSIIQLLELHDNYTKNHSHNVAILSQNIAKELDLTDNDIKNAYWAGLVHDIGKILISSKILNKKGRLEDIEYEQIKKHPFWGYKTLIQTKHLKDIANYVLHHHEHWDGSGYPIGLRENEIPLISQIITVADSWDAMRSDRSYREKISREIALQEIIDKKGIQFSPIVVDAFLRVIKKETSL